MILKIIYNHIDMAYWLLNKKSNEPKVFGSLPPLVEYTGLDYDSLQHIFSRKKETDYENYDFRICRVEIESGGKKVLK